MIREYLELRSGKSEHQVDRPTMRATEVCMSVRISVRIYKKESSVPCNLSTRSDTVADK